MALTKPKLSQNIDTDISVFTDPILVLHQGSSLANVDTGFLFNRANGLVSNVAVYWSESANSFVTAFTTSSGAPDANISITTYANLRTGTVTSNSITNSGTLVIGNTGDVSSNIGAFYTYANTTFATVSGTSSGIDANLGAFQIYANTKIGSNSNGNLVVAALTQSTSTTTGALVVGGGAAVGGNLYVGGNLIVSNVVYQNSEIITTTELVQGNMIAASSAVSTSTTTGALVVTGGAGIGGALYITNTGDVSANIGAYQTYANANVTAIQANLGAYQTYANANVVAIQANLGAYQTYANANVVAIQANLGAFQIFSNANAATQAISINSIVTNANANTAAYLLTATGNINAGNITTSGTSGNISGVNYIFAGNYVYANGVSILTGIGGTYSNTNVEAYIGGNIGAFYNYANTKIGTNTNSNLVINSTAESYGTTSGALVVKGGAGIAGNVYADALRTTTGIYWSGNGNPIAGITYTASASSPAGPSKGDQWYDTVNDILYEYIFDGTSSYWVDIQTSVIAANASTAITDSINANIGAFYTYANTKIGTNTNSNLVVAVTTASASNTTGALVVGGGVGITGNINLVYNPTSATGSAIQLTGKDTQGGTGWFDFLKATNTTSGATNPNKSIRLNSTGGLEIINSAYTTTILSLSDAGAMNISGSYQVAGKQAVNGPAFRAYIDGAQTITSGSQQKVTFGTETFDTNSNFSSSRFTPTVEGYYQLNATVRIDGTASTGEVMIILYKNGGEYARGTNEQGTEQGVNFYSMQVSDLAYANGTGDYFEIYIQQTSGGNRNTTAGTTISYFSGAMVRGA